MREKLIDILASGSPPEAVAWLRGIVASQLGSFEKRPFYYAFSGVSRHFDKRGLVSPSENELSALLRTVPGFTVAGWDQFRLARVVLLLTLAEQPKSTFLETLDALLNTADLREQAAIFSAYPILPHQSKLVESAVDGLRTNIVDVFDAIALDNPFPAEHFSDEEWNQMVLKAIFIGRPLYRIQGIDERANRTLARAISDLAHERWAAGRTITPEAWRSAAPFVDERIAGDVEKVAAGELASDREAAALVVSAARSDRLEPLRGPLETELRGVENGDITWHTLGRSLENR
ncbi:MAG: EboA domain-containing protein [Verrucomicrobiales bacterium]